MNTSNKVVVIKIKQYFINESIKKDHIKIYKLIMHWKML